MAGLCAVICWVSPSLDSSATHFGHAQGTKFCDIQPEVFRPPGFSEPPSGHGPPRLRVVGVRGFRLEGLTEVLPQGLEVNPNDPAMSAGYPTRKLPPWAAVAFLSGTLAVDRVASARLPLEIS